VRFLCSCRSLCHAALYSGKHTVSRSTLSRPSCGIIGADVRPNWKERSPQESLTGRQWS
jgi:hypothetical protein